MAFHEIRLDKDISYGSLAGVEYNTVVQELPNLTESRQSFTSLGRKSWKIIKENLSREEMFSLMSFFRARKGKEYGFRLLDLPNNDYLAVDEQIYTLIDNTHLQLVRTYPDAINAEIVKVTKPILVSDITAQYPDITLKRSTTGISGTYTAYSNSNWTIDRTTGIITFTSGSQAGNYFRWSGCFDWPVRFDVDYAEFNREAMDLHHWQQITIKGLKY